ncbi:vacuolar protein sorting-associated protein 33B [Pectinophora gossypiella]|uniref:vacuolar protein sorting-associated protein 33B n=1 Tax=Pectinophora gossypiella TaxID=13191 RepID=UPI00214EAAEB|nr:vacuolar protein sorting-associated protein 33B [Pectinophora gossypiella]
MEHPLHLKLASMSLISQCKLDNILSECGDKKDLIIDPSLIKPLERICGVSWLRQHGIDKIYKMDPQLGSTANTSRVYFIPACINKYKCVLDQISSLLSQNSALAELNCFHIIIVPKVLGCHDSILESRGLYGIVKLHPFAWELMALDEQLLSLELPFLYKQLFVEQNHSLLSSISMSLWSLFHVIGKPKAVFSLGKLSASVLDMLEIYNETYSRDFLSTESSQEIGAVIVVDRSQDYASSLLTPATYSGLLSEIFNINCGHLELNVKETKIKKGKLNFGGAEQNSETKHTIMSLDSSIDSLYGEIKHRHFAEVFSVLSSKAKLLKNEDIKALGIQEIKHFVATKLQQVALFKQNLVNHVLACETIISEMSNKFENLKVTETEMLNNRNKRSNFQFVDENFGTEIHIYNSLRLMCLLSLTQGLSYDEYNSLVNKYLLAFGYKFLYVFNNLINAGLLVQPSSPKLSLNISNLGNLSDRLPKWQNEFQSTASKLKQLPSQPDKVGKSSPSYVFNGGYVPLMAVLCNALVTSESLNEVLTKLSVLDLKIGGKILDKTKDGIATLNEKLESLKLQSGDLEFGCKDAKSLTKILKSDPNFGNTFPLKPKSVLIYMIGGVTYAEIAACDVVQTATGSRIYVASDCVASGSELMNANM